MVAEAPVSPEEKQEALETVLKSRTLARSAQLRAFLRYICECESAGHPEDLTEYRIAVNVLRRREDFNLSEDSSVRNRAYELRQRLEKFYTVEQPEARVRIEIPRGSYAPEYTRHDPAAGSEAPEQIHAPAGKNVSKRFGIRALAVVAVVCGSLGAISGVALSRPHPPEIIKTVWGPLANPDNDLLISMAINFQMMVRPHIAPYSLRLPAPAEVYSMYGPTRPLKPGTPLFMEPALLSVPLAEGVAMARLCTMRKAFGGSYQVLPESEAPIAALRGRDAILIGSGTNSVAASILLHNLPLTIGYTPDNRFAVIDQRKPVGHNDLFAVQATGQPVATTQYGLISVLSGTDASGKPTRTIVLSGTVSAGIQAAAEFLCSPSHLKGLRSRFRAAGLPGFPPVYQIVVRCRTVGLRLLSYQYVMHTVGQRTH